MIELGMRDKVIGAEDLKPHALALHKDKNGRPTLMPDHAKDERIVCGYDQGLGERLIVCESLEEMQALYDAYAKGGALRINWYVGKDPGFIIMIGNTKKEKPAKNKPSKGGQR